MSQDFDVGTVGTVRDDADADYDDDDDDDYDDDDDDGSGGCLPLFNIFICCNSMVPLERKKLRLIFTKPEI